jgi:COP9 signalosome complex subunit 7
MDSASGASALAKFVELGKSATDLAAAKNIELAVSNKYTFVFGELLHLPNVQALQSSKYTKHLALLQLFAYGTYTEYLTNKSDFPPLSELNVQKLRQLSIVTLAVKSKRLKYDMLMEKLEVKDVRSLEDLVIGCVYAGILEAKLDQKQKEVLVNGAIGRDLPPGGLADMIGKLGKWSEGASLLIENMGKQIEDANLEYSSEQRTKEQFLKDFEAKKKQMEEAEGGQQGQRGTTDPNRTPGGNNGGRYGNETGDTVMLGRGGNARSSGRKMRGTMGGRT